MPDPFATHEVFNQPPPSGDASLWSCDTALRQAVRAYAKTPLLGETALETFGQRWGSVEMAELGRLANQHPPELKTYDAHGLPADRVEFHPAWHALMQESFGAGLHASTWNENGSAVVRAAQLYMAGQVEAGHLCPVVMTHAAPAALKVEPSLESEWLPRMLTREYDSSFAPAAGKRGITLGMGMTEKQGGTDLRANTTRAEREGEFYRITGHKWFLSAPMSDAFLILAQAKEGLTCFLLPRFRPDGSVNALRLRRLKDKLGNRSNASSEAEFEGAWAACCGPEGAGIRTIIRMVQLTRLDCCVASAGLMQFSLRHALRHVKYRKVFGRTLAEQPLMRCVLGDLALDREGTLALSMRLARAFELAPQNENEAAFARIVTPAAKLWICKSAPAFVYEAMECIGGNGYVEETPVARAYREAPVNAIWEGSGNVMALDVLRTFEREREAFERVLVILGQAAHGLPGAERALTRIRELLLGHRREAQARRTAELVAISAAAGALNEIAPAKIAEAFALHRLHGIGGRSYGEVIDASACDEMFARCCMNDL